MNKRKTKKKHKYIIENIQKFKLDEDETLLIRFDHNTWSIASINSFHEYIQEKLKCRVMFIPKEFELSKVMPRGKRADMNMYDEIQTTCEHCGKELFVINGLYGKEYVCDDECYDKYNNKLKGE